MFRGVGEERVVCDAGFRDRAKNDGTETLRLQEEIGWPAASPSASSLSCACSSLCVSRRTGTAL